MKVHNKIIWVITKKNTELPGSTLSSFSKQKTKNERGGQSSQKKVKTGKKMQKDRGNT